MTNEEDRDQITIKQIYDAYKSSDLLGIGIDITPETTVDDIEKQDRECGIGDPLFLFLCYELGSKEYDPVDKEEAKSRLDRAIIDLLTVRNRLIEEPKPETAEHVGTLLATQIHAIIQLEQDKAVDLSLGKMHVTVQRHNLTYVLIYDGITDTVGSRYGAMQRYLQLVLRASKQVWVIA